MDKLKITEFKPKSFTDSVLDLIAPVNNSEIKEQLTPEIENILSNFDRELEQKHKHDFMHH